VYSKLGGVGSTNELGPKFESQGRGGSVQWSVVSGQLEQAWVVMCGANGSSRVRQILWSKSDEELLRLALAPEELTPEAAIALHAELARRRIGSAEQLSSFREAEKQRKQEEAKRPGRMFFHWRLGIGRLRLGRAERIQDPLTGLERFKTTVFVMLFWFRLICNSLKSTLRTALARSHVSDRANIPAPASQHPVLPDPVGGFKR
jgi:hypothetical protein